ncbi:MAG: hypothetical protein A2X94_16155 [Bdellovibrionales bacterium GWB1_55_8]|nr:MAG: hypothetical protein A2X94_16155 [Bdellovibrionales bacterium GWB1_55_8]
MENTSDVLFKDDVPQWYIAEGEKWVGPLTAADVYQKVVSQEISWAHYVWKPGQPEWKRICDLKTFQGAVPSIPKKAVLQEVKEAAKPAVRQTTRRAAPTPAAPSKPLGASDKIWFLYYNQAQFGPFSADEITRSLKSGKIHKKVFGWRDGMPNWLRLEEIAEYKNISAPPGKPAARSEQRSAPRRPLVAKIVMADDSAIHVAMCRDISIGGMQVLTDKVPGKVGKKIRMNVSSTGGELPPFVAEGQIVRVLEDQRGFSFRFDRLSEDARKTIEAYIRAEESS